MKVNHQYDLQHSKTQSNVDRAVLKHRFTRVTSCRVRKLIALLASDEVLMRNHVVEGMELKVDYD